MCVMNFRYNENTPTQNILPSIMAAYSYVYCVFTTTLLLHILRLQYL
jgi:hypothetical protein